MKYKPHDYQNYASEFIIKNPYCGLILDMGLGKTVITLSALWELILDYFTVGRVLVIAPKRGIIWRVLKFQRCWVQNSKEKMP